MDTTISVVLILYLIVIHGRELFWFQVVRLSVECPKKKEKDGSWYLEFQNLFQSVLGVHGECPFWFYQHYRSSPGLKGQSVEFSKGICGVSALYIPTHFAICQLLGV